MAVDCAKDIRWISPTKISHSYYLNLLKKC